MGELILSTLCVLAVTSVVFGVIILLNIGAYNVVAGMVILFLINVIPTNEVI